MKRKTLSRLCKLFAVVLLGAVAAIILLGDSLSTVFIPKIILRSALTESYSELEQRFFKNPIRLLLDNVNSEGKYTFDISLDAESPFLGLSHYEAILQTDAMNHSVQIQGNVDALDQVFSLELYINENSIAVSSDALLNGNYYGITYDSFSEDIKKIPLLRFAVSDSTVARWDSSLQELQKAMQQDYKALEIPNLSLDGVKALAVGLLTLPCETEMRSVSIEEQLLECRAITYQIEKEKMEALVEEIPLESDIEVTFYLYEEKLVMVRLKTDREGKQFLCNVQLGKIPFSDPFVVTIQENDREKVIERRVEINTIQDEELYWESWKMDVTENGKRTAADISYCWNPGDGGMDLNYNGEEAQLTLVQTGEGLSASSDAFSTLLGWLLEEKGTFLAEIPMSGTVTIKKGSQITQPQYKNLDQWSFEDFFALLEHASSFVGFVFE